MKRSEWKSLSLRDKATAILERCDKARLDFQGGYPSEWTFLAGHVVWATVGDQDRPELVVLKVPEFIQRYRDIITDNLENG